MQEKKVSQNEKKHKGNGHLSSINITKMPNICVKTIIIIYFYEMYF